MRHQYAVDTCFFHKAPKLCHGVVNQSTFITLIKRTDQDRQVVNEDEPAVHSTTHILDLPKQAGRIL